MIPLVSVIIPVYNAEKFIGPAIQSVLNQTFSNYEIIVINDGSTDGTREVLKSFVGKIRYLSQKNKGPSAARNLGIQIARGDLICFLDADDLWVSDKLEVQVTFMENHPDIGLLCSDHEEFDHKRIVLQSFLKKKEDSLGSNIIGKIPIDDPFLKLILLNFISTPTVMVRKKCFDKIGIFDESLRSIEDRDLWLRIAANFSIACLPGICCKRRVHQANISKNKELSLKGRIRVYERNWKLYPTLAPNCIWHSQLADTYCQLGYHLLQNNQRKSAMKLGFLSLKHLLQKGIGISIPRSPSLWSSLGLLLASTFGWKISRALWKSLKRKFQ